MVVCGALGGNGDEHVREIDFSLENDYCEGVGEGGYDKSWGVPGILEVVFLRVAMAMAMIIVELVIR